MKIYLISGILLAGIVAFAAWGYIQTHQEWKQEQREKEEIDEKVRMMIYGEKNDG